MTLVKWMPRIPVVGDFDRLLDNFFSDGLNLRTGHWSPAVDIEETDRDFVLTADLPGLKKKELKVTVHDGVLNITGEGKENKQKEEGNYHYRERRYGSFSRSFTLPESVNEEAITAKFENGSLILTIPKSEPVAVVDREIKIS